MTLPIDSSELLYAYLSGQSALISAITETTPGGPVVHLYGPPGVPANWTIHRAVMFLGSGGPGNDDLPLTVETFQFRCYGPEIWDAVTIYRTLLPTLTRIYATPVAIAGGEGLLQYARLISGPIHNIDPQTEWPYVMAMFQIHAGLYLLPA